VDNGPLCQHGVVDLTRYYRELGVQNVRLHDVNWSYGDVLDMEFLFPDWSADPERAESYNFTASDFYVKTISDLGIHIIFRLGYSAEGKSAARHNPPPPSYEKWAAVVEHIVRHYNEGWDNGLHANICQLNRSMQHYLII
jgi:xylan 1,4-beta-xylosidase